MGPLAERHYNGRVEMAKRKRSSAMKLYRKLEADGTVEIDDSSDSEAYEDQNSNSFSCNPTIPTTMQAAQDTGKSELNSLSFSDTFPHHERSHSGVSYENTIDKQKQRLDSHVFDCYLEHHWNLLILCHLGENLESKTRAPCMLLLDSLEMTNPKRFEPDIHKFLLDIYRAEERPEGEDLILKIPLLMPKVPQQRNGEDCGIFVLYFMNLFVEEAPENFSICESYPAFMKDNWFGSEHFENFCKDVRSSCW